MQCIHLRQSMSIRAFGGALHIARISTWSLSLLVDQHGGSTDRPDDKSSPAQELSSTNCLVNQCEDAGARHQVAPPMLRRRGL